MSSILQGYVYTIVARYGLASQVPTLLTGEIGFDTDTKVFRVGDDTPTPPRVMTDKSTGDWNYPDVTSLTIAGLTFADGKVSGVDLSTLNASNGFVARRSNGVFGNTAVVSGDKSLTVTGGNGGYSTVDVRVNMQLLQQRLAVGALPYVKKIGDVMTGALETTELQIYGAAGTARQAKARTVDKMRWSWGGDASAESGSNSGTDWALTRYNDNGVEIDSPISVDRASGFLRVRHGIVMPDGTVMTKGIELPPDSRGYLHNDGSGNLAWIDVDLTANITVLPPTIPNAIQGIYYYTVFSANGGTAPYTFTYTGSLPAGMTLSSTGKLDGTPASVGAGTFNITVTATDANDVTGELAYTFTVSDSSSSVIDISPDILPKAVQGVAYSQQMTATGGTSPYTFAIGSGSSLPAGLTMSSAGLISGTSTVSGAFSFIVKATDAAASTRSQSFNLTVDPAQFSYVISYDVDNLNLYNFANAPAAAGDYIFTINGGIYIRSPDITLPALRTGAFPAGSTLKIINNGNIQGMGGAGGWAIGEIDGANPGPQASLNNPLWNAGWAGENGGDAIRLDMPTTIDNSNGRIYGGGGGGMGGYGQRQQVGANYVVGNGGGGGGGQGAYTSNGGAAIAGGTPGQYGGPNSLGIGGQGSTYYVTVGGPYESGGGNYTVTGTNGTNGAAWGQAASTVTLPWAYPFHADMHGGYAGKAVVLSGHAITWVGGNNANQIKGAVS